MNIQATAYHEAGHVVAHIVQGLPVKSVTIVEGKDFYGAGAHPSPMMHSWSNGRELRQIARSCIVSLFAGMEAERVFDPGVPDYGSSQDEADAFEVSRDYHVFPRRMSCVGDDFHIDYLEQLRKESRRLIKRHWNVVAAVAQKLLTEKTVDGETIAGIIDGRTI